MPIRRGRTAAGIATAALLILTGCSSGGSSAAGGGSVSSSSAARQTSSATGQTPSSAPRAVASSTLPRPDHVMVVIFENEDAGDVLGAPQAPYLTSLAGSGATFTDAHGETHPSQPNYLALFSGSTQGVTNDSCPLTFSGPNLAAQLQAAGHSFTGYSEDLPSVGFQGCRAGGYARKHNPWVNFPALPASVNQPYSALPSDYAALPTVSFVVPNLCNDMHDCGVAAGDRWAKEHLAGYVDWARTHNSLLVITFDEDHGSAGNHIATFLVGPMVRAGTSDQRIDHYSLLRMIEDMYGLPPIGSAKDAAAITGIWTSVG
jgi:acid phosphatase